MRLNSQKQNVESVEPGRRTSSNIFSSTSSYYKEYFRFLTDV